MLRNRTIRLGLYNTITLEEGKPYDAYAWPGGYPIAYYTHGGDTLCADCATAQEEMDAAEDPELLRRFPEQSIWGCDVLEGSAIDHGIVACDQCSKAIVDIDADWEWQCDVCGAVNNNDTLACNCRRNKNDVGE